jgi:hypothetical protein
VFLYWSFRRKFNYCIGNTAPYVYISGNEQGIKGSGSGTFYSSILAVIRTGLSKTMNNLFRKTGLVHEIRN